MKYLLAHDLGTSGNKATLFDVSGRLLASEIAVYDVFYSNETWAEQNADDWWNAVKLSTKNLIAKAGVDGTDIAAISFSGQMMGCLCIDKEGKPLRNAIIWADSRAVVQSERLEKKISQEEWYHIVGHRNTPSYGIQKLMWVKDNEPTVYENTYKMLNAKDYIVYKLTGEVYTDYSDANSTGAFDIAALAWSDKIIEAAEIDRAKFPECKPSNFVAGCVLSEVAAELGLSTETKVVIGAGDGVAANVGAGSISPGKAYTCLGTSAWVTTTTDKPIFDENMRIVTWAHMVPGLYAPNGTMQYAGGAYKWIKDTICLSESDMAKQKGISVYDILDEKIAKSPAGANGLIFLPYFIGERAPRWDVDARGTLAGLKPENTREDILRSVLEGVSLNLSLILDLLRQHDDIDELVVLGGGAKGKSWREILANAFDAKLLVPALLDEAGAMGAAVNAGVGAGIYEDYSAIDKFIEIRDTELPKEELVKEYALLKEKFNDCYEALKGYYYKYGKKEN